MFYLIAIIVIALLIIYLRQNGYTSEMLHNIAVFALRILPSWCIPNYAPKSATSVNCMGLVFRNRVGLSAGWDKQAQCLRGLQKLGFGFVEIGGVTPLPQTGNPRPRVFRLSKEKAIINRYGLNSHGVDKIAKRLKSFRRDGMLVGANLAPNTATPPEQWLRDYAISLRKLYPLVDYFTVNISCPNTGHSESQRSFELLARLLEGIQLEAKNCAALTGVPKRPLLVKISPDLNDDAILRMKALVVEEGYDGIIATNTTTTREGVAGSRWVAERGGLSGRPVYEKMRHVVDVLATESSEKLCLVAVGGIENRQQVNDLVDKGVNLVQLYTRFAYRGPRCLQDLL